jgi:hypothetical protein
MNSALARRLALGDRVIWVGKDDCQPSGPGMITRITAHQVEVLWEGEIARRYRRAQLHNLRHVKLISAAAALHNRLESASFVGAYVVWLWRTLLDPSGQASPAERQPCRTAGARFTAGRVLGHGRRRA